MPAAPAASSHTKTAEQKIDLRIQRAPTSHVVIDLSRHGITEAEITPDLMGKYHTAGWRTVSLSGGTLTLSN